jgi:hypothetical protein
MILATITLTALWLYLETNSIHRTQTAALQAYKRQQTRREKLTVMHYQNSPIDYRD